MSAVSNTDDYKGEKSAGAILRETRETLGLSLDDAARVTRIGKAHLQALEEGVYDRLPSEVYIKGFLRVYAAYLKLPENEIIRAYEKDLSGGDPCPGNQEPSPRVKEENSKKSVKRLKWLYMVPAALALVAVSSYFLIPAPDTNNRNNQQFTAVSSTAKPPISVAPPVKSINVADEAQQQEITESEKIDKNEKIDKIENIEKNEKKKKKEKDTDIFSGPSPSSTGMVLKIKVVEDGWLDITIDDAITQHYELKSGDLIEWKGEKSISLDIGNAGGVKAELDGKALKPLGKSGEATHILFKAGAMKDSR